MEQLMPILMSLITGGIGGNIVGAIFQKLSLGLVGNTLAGVLGGGLGSQILSGAMGGGLVGDIASAATGGGVLMLIVGLIKQVLGK